MLLDWKRCREWVKQEISVVGMVHLMYPVPSATQGARVPVWSAKSSFQLAFMVLSLHCLAVSPLHSSAGD